MAEVYQKKDGVWTKIANDHQFGVGFVYETLSDSETTATLATRYGGTWVALSDKIEDKWNEYPCTYNETTAGTVSDFKLYAKVSEDKQFVDVQVSCYIELTGSSTTSAERAIAQAMSVKGTSFTNAGIAPINMLYVDAENATQTASFYISGNNTLWFGANKTGDFKGNMLGRKLIAYNSIFTPDMTIKRFRRVS